MHLKKMTKKDRPPNRKFRKKTGCEKAVMQILDEIFADYEDEYPIFFAGEWKVYDFRIGNTILIEVDGDHWHGNLDEDKDSGEIKKHYQLKNKKNDMLKNFIAKKRGFYLLRIWESDVFDNREETKGRILAAMDEYQES